LCKFKLIEYVIDYSRYASHFCMEFLLSISFVPTLLWFSVSQSRTMLHYSSSYTTQSSHQVDQAWQQCRWYNYCTRYVRMHIQTDVENVK